MRKRREAPILSDTKSSDPFARQVMQASPRGGAREGTKPQALVFTILAPAFGHASSYAEFFLCVEMVQLLMFQDHSLAFQQHVDPAGGRA